jgi:hypothetical protein
MPDMREILEQAREIYLRTMCGGAGCCGDIDGALEYIDGSVGEMLANSRPREQVGQGGGADALDAAADALQIMATDPTDLLTESVGLRAVISVSLWLRDRARAIRAKEESGCDGADPDLMQIQSWDAHERNP